MKLTDEKWFVKIIDSSSDLFGEEVLTTLTERGNYSLDFSPVFCYTPDQVQIIEAVEDKMVCIKCEDPENGNTKCLGCSVFDNEA